MGASDFFAVLIPVHRKHEYLEAKPSYRLSLLELFSSGLIPA